MALMPESRGEWPIRIIVIVVVAAAIFIPLFLNYTTIPGVILSGLGYEYTPPLTPTPTVIVTTQTTSPPTSQPTPPPTSPPTLNPDGLLVWYTFDDDFTASNVVPDKSGNGHDARVTGGSVSKADGIAGSQAISFSGSGYIKADSNPTALRKDLTISLWFRTANPDNNYKLASAARWGGGSGSGWVIGTHVPEFWAEDGEGVLVPAQQNKANNFLAGEWNHEVVNYDGITVNEYTNGQLINTWVSRGVPMGSGEPLAVGAWPQIGSRFVGQIDDFRIYDRALSDQEINALYRQEQ